jgi:hypothetical protein
MGRRGSNGESRGSLESDSNMGSTSQPPKPGNLARRSHTMSPGLKKKGDRNLRPVSIPIVEKSI